MGQDVQCPTCGGTFLAQAGGNAASSARVESRREEPRRELERSSRRDRDDDDDEYDRSPRRSRRRRRTDYEPHRGGMIMALGIVSLFFAPLILGPISWIMGNNDLEAIRAGRMDPEGESQTNTGRICGMIATIYGAVVLVIVLGFFCVWLICAVGMFGAAASGPKPKRF
jgi:hypothetical protein